ncbi:MAG: carbon starvation protein A, partial [Verrucomicrobia bacterium]|nr:carbon starvation protein A [Verrucomicrobiota bacterium]
AWSIIIYGLAASILPVWLLLAPRDYLSTFMKLGTIIALAGGVLLVLPDLKMPAVSKFADGSGLVVPGTLFPFCFITIACGAISGFHTLIASGITPKIITREGYSRPIGYGAMLLESLVAIMAMIAACTLDPGVYMGMNVVGTKADIIAKVEQSGMTWMSRGPDGTGPYQQVPVRVSEQEMDTLAQQMGEKTLFGRTGGAATLAVGMAQIFSRMTQGRWLDIWYHFALMFEALFILTTLDAGTRVGRYLLQDGLGRWIRPLRQSSGLTGNVLSSLLVVGGWGFFLICGVRDPEGGIKALWPIFGIANQLLASIALCLATSILLKMQLNNRSGSGRPVLALVTLVPLVWLLSVTTTASLIKIAHPDPRIGFVAAASRLDQRIPELERQLGNAQAAGSEPAIATATKALKDARTVRFNNRVDAVITVAFLGLSLTITGISSWLWIQWWRRTKKATLHESDPVWLPETSLKGQRPAMLGGTLALGWALMRELSGEAAVERTEARMVAEAAASPETGCGCNHSGAETGSQLRARAYEDTLEHKYRTPNRCC